MEQIRVLRDRVTQLEAALASGTDPLLLAMGEHVRQLVHVVTPEGRLLATGRPSEGFGSVVGRSVYEFLEPASVDVVREAYARTCATAQSVVYESMAYGEDGSPGHTYLSRTFPLINESGVYAILVVPTDITARVALERTLVEQEQTLRLAIQASRLGLWRWDVATGVVSWDARLCEIWGVSETPRDYEAYAALLHPDDRDKVERHVREAIETGVFRTFEHRTCADARGVVRWVLAAGSVIKDAHGNVIQVMGGALDITEQKELLAQQQRAARVETIGQLTAGIAHNFNNLLAVIVPHAELLLTNARGDQQPSLSAMLEASLQARDLVRNLLSLTQREDTRSSRPADPREVVERIVAICRVTFPREILLQHTIAVDASHVAMPVGDLEQVLLNLLFNARDAIESGRGSARAIDVRATRVSIEGTSHVELSVSDTGSGMSAEVRGRVFEPFFTTKPPHKGSGLGLANVLARVRDAGGSIDCQSTPEVGTTFVVRLPLRAVQRVTPKPEPTVAASTARGARVLLVDDEPLVRGVLRRLLEREGHVVLEAGSAEQAREVLRSPESAVEVVILDQSMPRETGIQALPSLRALTRAPVVLFTGMAPEVSPEVDALLEKPARPEELERVLRAVLAKRR